MTTAAAAAQFSTSFWSPDYKTGVGVIFDKLRQGINENTEVLNMVSDRIQIENSYAANLQTFPVSHSPTPGGFNRDEGASLRQSYVSFLDEICNQGLIHAKIAADLERNIRAPFAKWAQGHKIRISESEALVMNKINMYLKKELRVSRLQQAYFAKCRRLEELNMATPATAEKSDDSSLADNTLRQSIDSISKLSLFKRSSLNSVGSLDTQASDASDASTLLSISHAGAVDLGGLEYSPESLGVLLHAMLAEIPRGDYRMPIVGLYTNVSTGDSIVLWVRKHLEFRNVARAEKFGQSLLDYGFLKAVGLVNSRFMNSSGSRYQWQQRALVFEETDTLFREQPDLEEESLPASDSSSGISSTNSSIAKASNEVKQEDYKYRQEVLELDEMRCNLETAINETLNFVERCESDRLKALTKVLDNFTGDLGVNYNKLPGTISRMNLFQESINPENDVQYLIKSYKTSYFAPKTVIYNNFDPSITIQTFGVSLNHSSFAVTLLIDYIAQRAQEEELEKEKLHQAKDAKIEEEVKKQVRFADTGENVAEETPLDLWLNDPVPVSTVYSLRKQINTGSPFDTSLLDFFPLSAVIRTFKEFLLELPTPVISFTIYDLIKGVYNERDVNAEADASHVEALAGSMAQLDGCSLDVLKQIINHFISNKSLYDLDDFSNIQRLSSGLAQCLFRPRVVTGLSMEDKHPALLIRDILMHHEKLFQLIAEQQNKHKEAKRERSASTSEHNRKMAIEERQRALAALSARSSSRNTPVRASDTSLGSPLSVSSPSSVTRGNGLLPLTLSPNSRLSTPVRHKRKTSMNMGVPLVAPSSDRQEYKMVILPASPENSAKALKNKELPAPPMLVTTPANDDADASTASIDEVDQTTESLQDMSFAGSSVKSQVGLSDGPGKTAEAVFSGSEFSKPAEILSTTSKSSETDDNVMNGKTP